MHFTRIEHMLGPRLRYGHCDCYCYWVQLMWKLIFTLYHEIVIHCHGDLMQICICLTYSIQLNCRDFYAWRGGPECD